MIRANTMHSWVRSMQKCFGSRIAAVLAQELYSYTPVDYKKDLFVITRFSCQLKNLSVYAYENHQK